MRTIVEKLNIIQPICESRESDRVIGYLKDIELSIDFIKEFQNGNIWGVYRDEDNDLVYETRDGDVYVLGYDIRHSEDYKVIFDASDSDWCRNPKDHAYLIREDGLIEELVLDGDSADYNSGVRYYQGDKGALVTWEDADGTEDPEKSGFYYTNSFEEWKDFYLE